jgi:hypothetical protein
MLFLQLEQENNQLNVPTIARKMEKFLISSANDQAVPISGNLS